MSQLPATLQYLSTKAAAEELGVSRHQVAMLAKNGEVNSLKVENVLLIDPFSLRQYKQLHRGMGRPLSPPVAWAALWLLSGLDAPWLSYPQRRRLLIKLRDISPEDLVWQTRKRSTLRLFKAAPAALPEVRKLIVLSGKSTDRPDIFGMPRNVNEVEGYAGHEELEQLRERFNLYEDVTGNLLVHTMGPYEVPWPDGDVIRAAGERQLPVAAVAADLSASLDPREARAGITALAILLRGFNTL